MKMAKNFLLITAGMLIVLTGYVWGKAEMVLEGSPLGYLFDGCMMAALFFGMMQLLKWAVWVLG